MIKLTNISKSYFGKFLLKDITYHFPAKQKVALFGVNGAGKSTLLNIICGLDESDAGSVDKPKNVTSGYLPQEPNPNPLDTIWLECIAGAKKLWDIKNERDHCIVELENGNYSEEILNQYNDLEHEFNSLGGYELESLAFKILTGLGIKEDKFQADPRSLSGGWKMRLELARTLINQPDFLILDEPTNHLDLPALEWLEKFLIEFQGTVFFVSHDQDFLNKLSTITLHLAGGTIKEYKGNLDYFLEQRELNQLQSESKAKHIQDRAKQIQKFVDRFRASPAKAGVVGSRLKMLNRLKDLEDTLSYEKPFEEMSIAFPIKKPSGNVVINLEEVSIGYEKPLIKNLNMHIMRGEKVAITGANGLGKSTILKSIAGMLKPLKGKVELGNDVQIGYFAQDHNDGFDDNLTLMEQIRLFATKQEDQHIRKLLGCFLFKKDDAFKKVGILSGGERSRLRLCSLIAADSNFLILDEPTNHLDMTSINLLSHALSEYEGTILFVSHNRSFISQVATQSLKIEDFVF